MRYFNFDRLITKYSTEFIVRIPIEGGNAKYGTNKPKTFKNITMQGAIISHSETKIFRSEGTLSQQDKALYMLKPIDNALKGAELVHDNKVYRIGDLLENSTFTGVWSYSLKYISVFNDIGGGNND